MGCGGWRWHPLDGHQGYSVGNAVFLRELCTALNLKVVKPMQHSLRLCIDYTSERPLRDR